MRVKALVKRILRQLLRDKRTIGLLIMAPIIVLTMLYFVFNGGDYISKVGIINGNDIVMKKFAANNVQLEEIESENLAHEMLENQQIDAYIVLTEKSPEIVLEGSDPTVTGATMKWLQQIFNQQQHDESLPITFLHGSENMSQFDYFGPVLLGFFIFFFVFLIGGVSFLRERTTGTLDRLLASPLRRWEIVAGYVIGFGIFTVIQSVIISFYAIYVLKMVMNGSLIYVLLTIFVTAMTALTLGILLSTFAHNELQMMQFIPIIVVPQIFFSGLFNLETIAEWLSWISIITPLYYTAEVLRDVMVRGNGFQDIYINILIIFSFSVVFMIINTVVLRKHRQI